MTTPKTRTVAAAVAGLVLMMSGCATEGPAESGDIYVDARERYTAMADELHAVIMAIEPTDWLVDQGQYGAVPGGCQLGRSSDTGYSFTAVRTLELPGRDVDEITASASAAFDDLGVEPQRGELGEGESQEITVLGESDAARTVVTVQPATGLVRVSSTTSCEPGSATEIAETMYGGRDYPLDVWRRLPATEGPDSVPQFYFPADGPLYYDADGTPVTPQPVVTVAPTPPADE